MNDNTSMINIDRSLLKKKIRESGIKHHQKAMEDFREMVNEIMISETLDVGEFENHQRSFKSETLAEVRILSDQLQLANQELDQLLRIRSHGYENPVCAEYGKVVKTDKEIFFIFSAIDRFYAVNLPVYGLPVHSQLYKVMKGKKAGDNFTHADITYHIEEIF